MAYQQKLPDLECHFPKQSQTFNDTRLNNNISQDNIKVAPENDFYKVIEGNTRAFIYEELAGKQYHYIFYPTRLTENR